MLSENKTRNKTIDCTEEELNFYKKDLLQPNIKLSVEEITDRIIQKTFEEASPFLPKTFADLVILDPPYNLTKNYNGNVFKAKENTEYQKWFAQIISLIIPLVRPTTTIYVCSDWRTSNLIFPILDEHFCVRNRITWEREKGRGAKKNWKNNTEDIWFCTVGDDYFFNVDAVKLKRRVIAPYRTEDGSPKDWEYSTDGKYRLTYPSNIWGDITIPFWSMPENTNHPTQKPEKLIAKLILASSKPGDFIFDPFLGSGTTAVVAKKLLRKFCAIETNCQYCCWAAKRLKLAETDNSIQGYKGGVFWERNTQPHE